MLLFPHCIINGNLILLVTGEISLCLTCVWSKWFLNFHQVQMWIFTHPNEQLYIHNAQASSEALWIKDKIINNVKIWVLCAYPVGLGLALLRGGEVTGGVVLTDTWPPGLGGQTAERAGLTAGTEEIRENKCVRIWRFVSDHPAHFSHRFTCHTETWSRSLN